MDNQNLYPPIVETAIPAFERAGSQGGYKITFKNSQFNSASQRLYAHLTVRNQNSNISVLDNNKYPNGIIQLLVMNEGDDNLSVILPNDAATGGSFTVGQFYKIQIRFSSIVEGAVDSSGVPSSINVSSGWLAENRRFFSEWSTITLIKIIGEPSLSIHNLKESSLDASYMMSQDILEIVGTLSFEDDDSEILSKYRAKLYDDKGDLLADSGDQYSNPYQGLNQLNYTFNYTLRDGERYSVDIIITTKNNYTKTFSYEVAVVKAAAGELKADIGAEPDNNFGRIKVSLKSSDGGIFTGNVTIRRSDSKNNFTTWEDVHTAAINEGALLDYTWYDNTIESGVFYRYCAQRRDSHGNRGVIITHKAPVICEFDDMFLSAEGKHLRVKYNQKVGGYKRNILESKVDTIGSKYPFIRRNGQVDYRTFGVSGLITFLMDDEEEYAVEHSLGVYGENKDNNLFVSKTGIYGEEEVAELYQKDKEDNDKRINEYNDYIKEKFFRDKVIDFLYSDNIKMFRTLTEGNMLIKLMDISLEPDEVQGRYTYSFSATAVEVDDFTIENCDKYNIQNVGTYSADIARISSVLGQVQGAFYSGFENELISNTLKNKYQRTMAKNRIATVKNLSLLRVQFESEPYLIQDINGNMTKVENGGSYVLDNTLLGYGLIINETTQALVPAHGFYELAGDDLEIKSVRFLAPCEATIDYIATLEDKENVAKVALRYVYDSSVGQLWGTFNYEDSLYVSIWDKYYRNYSAYLQKIIAINGLNIEGEEGTIVWIKDSSDSSLQKHILNPSGRLRIYDTSSVIISAFFGGMHLMEKDADDELRFGVQPTKYSMEGTAASISSITSPVENGVYLITGIIPANISPISSSLAGEDPEYDAILQEKAKTKYVIYYHNEWYKFALNDNGMGGDVLCDVDALVDYVCETSREEYR